MPEKLVLPKVSVKAAEKALNIPAQQWKGRCYEIACAMVKAGLVKGITRYGHWLGPVSPRSFFSSRAGLPFSRHGWIEVMVGTKKVIVDPTRWVFEAAKPYIFIGVDNDGYYDVAGNSFRAATVEPPPPRSGKIVELKVSASAAEFLTQITGELLPLSQNQIFWLANLPVQHLGDQAHDIYSALVEAGLGAFIPIDNRKLVLE